MDNKEEIIQRGIKKLDKLKHDVENRLYVYTSAKEKLVEEGEEVLDKSIFEGLSDLIEENEKKQKAYKNALTNIRYSYDAFFKQKSVLSLMIGFNKSVGRYSDFLRQIDELAGMDTDAIAQLTDLLEKLTGISCPLKTADFKEFNAKLFTISVLNNKTSNRTNIPVNLQNDDVIKNSISLAKDMSNTTGIFLSYLKQTEVIIKRKQDESAKEVANYVTNNISKRKEELSKKEEMLNSNIEKCMKELDDIEEAYKVYESYKTSADRDNTLKLSGGLSKLGVISKREEKKLIHVKKEKEKKVEEKVEEPKVELVKEERKPLDLDYYHRNDTGTIICFLGNDGNSIWEDIDKHFDNSKRPIVLGELNHLFNQLYLADNYIVTGGKPKYFSDSKAIKLTESPFKFNYRRYGVASDQYRIHAIERSSDLLKELGYGSGQIIFFGAVGVNDTKQKSDAYGRLGSRAIDYLDNKGRPAKLNSDFDYIEHITRKCIPVELLSYHDLNRLGDFNGKLKGTDKDKSYESGKYILYDVLDDDSKQNVKEYLDKYFYNQSIKMFEIINEYNNIKGNNLD